MDERESRVGEGVGSVTEVESWPSSYGELPSGGQERDLAEQALNWGFGGPEYEMRVHGPDNCHLFEGRGNSAQLWGKLLSESESRNSPGRQIFIKKYGDEK